MTGTANWKIDRDRWYVRLRRKGDPKIDDEPCFGFTTASKVYVRTEAQTKEYDMRSRYNPCGCGHPRCPICPREVSK